MGDVEMCTNSAPADAPEITRRCCGVHVAKQEPVAPNVADGIEARRPVLSAEVLHLGREGEVAAIAELAACASGVVVWKSRIRRIERGVRSVELHGVRGVHARNG